jgi:transcriptional repressor NrdR|uniref:Transcriptional repressor NrdR n=1 Tax=candidate division WOR-3 bacterium TaxID=2052148 RepID=A0A7C3YQR2_UNCW3
MRCPNCGKDADRVCDSRLVLEGSAIRRRRECSFCGQRFTTFEYIERVPIMVIKSDGRREVYERDKLISGILLACRKRPISREMVEELVNSIEKELADEYRLEIESKELGEMVLKRLLKLDEVAYVRFASVYKKFENIKQFQEELQRIKEMKRKGGEDGKE